MATGNAKRFVEIGVAPALAKELAAQITAGVGNFRRLQELGMPGAKRVATGITTGTFISRNRLAETSIPPRLIREILSQRGSSGTPVSASIAANSASGTTIYDFTSLLSGNTIASVIPTGATPANTAAPDGTNKLVVTTATALAAGSYSYNVTASTGTVYALSLTASNISVTQLPVLTTGGATYYAVHAPVRLISGYSGPLQRANDGTTTTDMGTGASYVTPAAVQALRASNTDVRLDISYDQSGNALNATQVTAASRPAAHEAGTINGIPAIIFDGQRTGDSRGTKQVGLLATHSLARANMTVALVLDSIASIQRSVFWEYYTGTTTNLAQTQDETTASLGQMTINNGASLVTSGKFLPACPTVVVWVSGASGIYAWMNGVKLGPFTAAAAATLTNLCIGTTGQSTVSLKNFYPDWRCGAFVAINAAVNDADAAAISSSLMATFGVPTSYDAIVTVEGSSRDRGGTASYDAFNRGFYERAYFTPGKKVQVYNFGYDAQPQSTAYTNRAAHTGAVYDPTKPFIVYPNDAINDLGGLGASTNPATIYTTLSNWVSYVHGLGSNAKCLLATTLPQNSTAVYGGRSDAAIDADRVTLNASIVGNAAGADAVADPASDPLIGAHPVNNGYYAADNLHCLSSGYQVAASYSGPKIKLLGA